MAIPINDGYTEHVREGQLEMEYRPLLLRGRSFLAYRLERTYSKELKLSILRDMICFRIVSMSPETKAALVDEFENHIGFFRRVLGVGCRAKEVEDQRNLFNGVWLALKFPRLAKVSCDNCRKYWFDPLEAKYTVIRDGKPVERDGGVVLCETREGCPAGHFTKQNRLSEKNKKAYEHWLECRAIGEFPDDSIVRRNAYVIQKAFRACQRKV